MVLLTKIIIDIAIAFAPNTSQAIIGPNADPVHWHKLTLAI